MVVVALALVLLLAGRVMGASGSTSSGGGTSGGTPSTGHASTTPASHPTATATSRATAAGATGTPMCPDSAIKVSVATDALSYPAAVVPGLTISVTNTGSTACARDVGAGALGLLITSGQDRVWSSDDCQKAAPPQLRTIAPGTSQSQTVAWTRHRSDKACPTTAPADAQPGTYVLTGHAGGVTSKPVVFRLG